MPARTSRAACASPPRPTVGDEGFERTERLIDAGVDLVVVDTAHGHSQPVLDAVDRIKRLSNQVQVVAGNVATAEGAKALIDAGADAIKVGIGPGSICTTRIVAGVGVPQLTAIMDAVEAAQKAGVPVIADGGIKYSGDLAKALAAGADCAMIGSLLAGTDETPGRGLSLPGPLLQNLSRHGLGRRHGARLGRPLLPAGQSRTRSSSCRKASRGRCRTRARSRPCCTSSSAACARRWAMSAPQDLAELRGKATFVRISRAGLRESHVHDVTITRESPNYPSRV